MQRIVITSSGAAVITVPQSKPTVYTEQDWNSSSVKVVEEMGNKSPPVIAYYASKTLAEKGGFLNILAFLVLLLHVSCDQRLGIFMSSTRTRLNGI